MGQTLLEAMPQVHAASQHWKKQAVPQLENQGQLYWSTAPLRGLRRRYFDRYLSRPQP